MDESPFRSSETVFTTDSPVEVKSATTAVISCSGRELQAPLRDFLDQGLHLEEGTFFLLSVPGGSQLLAATEYLPKFAWAGHRWLRFLVEKGGVRRIVLVGHQGCLWYLDESLVPSVLHQLMHRGQATVEERQRHDLSAVAATLRSALPGVAVDAYFAERLDDGRLAFQRQ